MTDDMTDADVLRGARQLLYRFFALALSDPRSARWPRITEAEFQNAAAAAAAYLARAVNLPAENLAPGELGPEWLDLTDALRVLDSESRARMTESHDRTFGLLLSKECPQYETEYSPQAFSVFRSHEQADVAGFYRAFGLEPSRDCPERADHVALELEFMAWVLTLEQHALETDPESREERLRVCRAAQGRFFESHIMWWIPAFAHAMRRKVDDRGFHGAVSRSLAAFIAVERSLRGLSPPTELLAPRPAEQVDAACGGCASAGGAAD